MSREPELPAGAPEAAATALAGCGAGAAALEPLVRTVLDALVAGAARRGGPVPAGTPEDVGAEVARALAHPDRGGALGRLTALLAYGSADPADPSCAAHLHSPPLA
ncbi:hypothetical protein ABZ297_41855, partial [Nonomuraea sp. NPDC005983]